MNRAIGLTRLAGAKRRWSHRQDEAGAAMFIVSMTLTVLASVGIYALAAASNEVRTSGYERQNTQTHYLASYGVLGIAHEIITETRPSSTSGSCSTRRQGRVPRLAPPCLRRSTASPVAGVPPAAAQPSCRNLVAKHDGHRRLRGHGRLPVRQTPRQFRTHPHAG